MLDTQRVFASILLCFSVLPFILGVGIAYEFTVLSGYPDFMRGYAAALIIFLAGFRVKELLHPVPRPRMALLFCLLFIAVATAALFLPDLKCSLSLQLMSFLGLLALELYLRDQRMVSRWYFRLRLITSFAISFCMLLILTSEF